MSDQNTTAPATATGPDVEVDATQPTPSDVPVATEPTTEPPAAVATPSSDDDPLSRKVTLADLCARAAAQYARRAYEAAADTYAQAAQLQADLRGELDPENAEILFLYGRALFKLGQGKSQVLGGGGGGKAGGEEGKGDKVREVLAGRASAEGEGSGKKKGLVQLDDLEEEVEEEEGEGEEGAAEEGGGEEGAEDEGQEEEGDDLESAFQALDLAGVLFKRKLEALVGDQTTEQEAGGKEKESAPEGQDSDKDGDDQMARHVKERLGDTHDLLAEIHLESERFPAAIDDCRQSLAYKLGLFAPDDAAIAEAHYKLSLALEFASLVPADDDAAAASAAAAAGSDAAPEKKGYDEKLRAQAVEALEAAITSTRLKLQAKEVELATSASPDENDATRVQIADVKDMISEMEDRLADLRKPPQDLTAELLDDAVAGFAQVLGGKSASEQAALLQEAQKDATDLTGLVRRKNPEAGGSGSGSGSGSGKRKASSSRDGDGDGHGDVGGTESKKARVEDA